MENIKQGSVVYWNKTGAKAYWSTDLNNPVEFLSEEFLEGETVGYPYPYAEQFAEDVPNQGTSIPVSVIDTIAGTVTGEIVEKNGASFYPIRMPFTFYNLDGQNRDDSTKSLKVFVNVADLTISTQKAKKEAENKTLVDSVLADDTVTGKNSKKSVAQADNDDTKTKTGTYILIGVVVVIICGVIYYFSTRNKPSNTPQNYVQNPPNTAQQMRYVVPPNRLQTV
jgi:hypothetical protein